MKYIKSWPMLQREREAKARRQRGALQNWVIMLLCIAIVSLIGLAIVEQHSSNKTADNICFNTDPQYGCSTNHPQ